MRKQMDKKILAKSIAHYVYRDTKLEDFHSRSIFMNKEFYSTVYKIVYRKTQIVKKYLNYIYEIKNIYDIKALIIKYNLSKPLEFYRFAYTIFCGLLSGSDWNDPQPLTDTPTKSIASYILNGHFKECCNNHKILDDSTMCYINQDIYNRTYTLLINGYFDVQP